MVLQEDDSLDWLDVEFQAEDVRSKQRVMPLYHPRRQCPPDVIEHIEVANDGMRTYSYTNILARPDTSAEAAEAASEATSTHDVHVVDVNPGAGPVIKHIFPCHMRALEVGADELFHAFISMPMTVDSTTARSRERDSSPLLYIFMLKMLCFQGTLCFEYRTLLDAQDILSNTDDDVRKVVTLARDLMLHHVSLYARESVPTSLLKQFEALAWLDHSKTKVRDLSVDD